MKRSLGLGFIFILSTSLIQSSCATSKRDSSCVVGSQRLSEALSLAVSRADRRCALELVILILEDEAGSGDRFDHEIRWNAENAIRDLRLSEVSPLLRRVAAMHYPAPEPQGHLNESDSQRDFLRYFAISSALSSLTVLRDSEAGSLNRRHIATPRISTTATRNLMTLEDWGATAQVRRLLATREHTTEAFLDLSAALGFLVASPESNSQDCDLARRLSVAYGACFRPESEPPGFAGCDDFVRAVGAFEARFHCKT